MFKLLASQRTSWRRGQQDAAKFRALRLSRLRTSATKAPRQPKSPKRPQPRADPVVQDDDSDEDEDLEDDSDEDLQGLRSGFCGPQALPSDVGDPYGPDHILDGKPMWLRDLEADMENDPEVRDILEGTDGDPNKVLHNMSQYTKTMDKDLYGDRFGVEKPMRVVFRSMDPMCVYFWLELYRRPGPRQMELLNEAVRSWFIVGRLGGYNAMNLQVHRASDHDLSYLPYKTKLDPGTFASFYHELSELENKDQWVRFRADLGTGDEIGLDILINMLQGVSKEHLGIKKLCVGGQNEDWPIPSSELAPEITMNPMSAYGGEDDDDEDDDEDEEGLPTIEDLPDLMEQFKTSNPDKYGKLKDLQNKLDKMNLPD